MSLMDSCFFTFYSLMNRLLNQTQAKLITKGTRGALLRMLAIGCDSKCDDPFDSGYLKLDWVNFQK